MTTDVQGQSQLVDELLERIGRTVGQQAQVSAVFGEPVERKGLTVIPVARARFGFGGGGGSGSRAADGSGAGGGGGGGGVVNPVGFIEVRDGSAEFRRIVTPIDLLPAVAAASLVAVLVRRLLA
jgi:uncharacterized spore protein YtfJ